MLRRDRGFTLIELILILAIAGLIMIMVFLGVMGAQKSRRDAQRKSDLGKISAALDDYAAMHNNVYPTNAEAADSTSDFRQHFGLLAMRDPAAGQPYVVTNDFSACSSTASYDNHGPGYISYVTPGVGGTQFTLRICLDNGTLTIDQ